MKRTPTKVEKEKQKKINNVVFEMKAWHLNFVLEVNVSKQSTAIQTADDRINFERDQEEWKYNFLFSLLFYYFAY